MTRAKPQTAKAKIADAGPDTVGAAPIKGVIKTKTFRSEGDFINKLLSEHAMERPTDKDGNQGKAMVSIDRLKALAKENGITHRDSYPNPGMWRMNIGNMLRAKARKEGQLLVDGKVHKVPNWVAPAAKKSAKAKAA